jgi:hypothetical protein
MTALNEAIATLRGLDGRVSVVPIVGDLSACGASCFADDLHLNAHGDAIVRRRLEASF